MPKLVCDFEAVKTIGDNLIKTAGEMTDSLKTYSGNIDNDLSGWNSPAKNSFTSANTTQVTTANANAELATKLGEFIKLGAESIQKLDEELASKISI